MQQSAGLSSRNRLYLALFVGLFVFSLSVLGISTRAHGLLAAFWPANAALMGILIRFPGLNTPLSWLMAVLGYLIADFIFGTPFPLSLFLTAGNIVGIIAGVWLYSNLSSQIRELKEPMAVIYLILICCFAASLCGVAGMIGYPIFWGGEPFKGFKYWFSTELVNYLALLPLILTCPDIRLKERRQHRWSFNLNKQKIGALTALLSGLILSVVIGGPGSLAFLIPGLLWCSITFSVFETTFFILVSSIWLMLLVSTGAINLGVNIKDAYALESFRLGLTFVMLSPLTVASVMAARNNLVKQLAHTATHDQLTKTLNRFGFYERAAQVAENGNYALLLCDIDNFKNINDTNGHKAGDSVLTEFAGRVAQCLRDDDIFARIGGEEFCIVLSDSSSERALILANRLCDICAEKPYTDGANKLDVTLSIGLFHNPGTTTLEQALKNADTALYEAKNNGRNQVVTF